MITAFGNNFGAGTITFKDFQKNGLVVLNGSFTVDPSNARYQQAKDLVISVPAVSLKKSAYTSVYLIIGEGEQRQMMIVKSWFSHPSTIHIERLRKYESLGVNFTYLFCCAYVSRAEHEEIVPGFENNSWASSEGSYMLIPGFHYGKFGDLLFLFGAAYGQPYYGKDYEEGTEIVFSHYLQLPKNVNLDVPMFLNQDNNGKKSYLHWGHVRNGQLVIDPLPKAMLAEYPVCNLSFCCILIMD